MTREEAIKSLQNIIEYWTYKPTEVEAAKMAIAALRPVMGAPQLGQNCVLLQK